MAERDESPVVMVLEGLAHVCAGLAALVRLEITGMSAPPAEPVAPDVGQAIATAMQRAMQEFRVPGRWPWVQPPAATPAPPAEQPPPLDPGAPDGPPPVHPTLDPDDPVLACEELEKCRQDPERYATLAASPALWIENCLYYLYRIAAMFPAYAESHVRSIDALPKPSSERVAQLTTEVAQRQYVKQYAHARQTFDECVAAGKLDPDQQTRILLALGDPLPNESDVTLLLEDDPVEPLPPAPPADGQPPGAPPDALGG